jgi:hypothetical protein
MNKYELVDLGKPTSRIVTTAYIITPTKNLMIKGGNGAVRNHLDQMARQGIRFFGKVRNTTTKNSVNRTYNIQLVSCGFYLQRRRKPGEKRYYYELIDEKLNVAWTKKFRRLPEKWPKEIPTDIMSELVITADFLEERGFLTGATVLRELATKYTASRNLAVRVHYH